MKSLRKYLLQFTKLPQKLKVSASPLSIAALPKKALCQAYFLNTTFDLSGSGTLSFCQKSSIYEENFENFTK